MTTRASLNPERALPQARRARPARGLACIVVLAAAAPLLGADAPAPTPLSVADLKRTTPVDFEKEILPILSTNCLACHNRTKAKADLVLETPADMLKGGESGPSLVPKKPDDSLLLKVTAHRQDPVMPPKGNKVAASDLTSEQLGLVKLWIDQGATGTIGGGAGVPTVQWQAVPAGLHAVYAVALTPDGQYAACSRGSEVHVYHLPTAKLVARVGGPGSPAPHRDLVQSLAFSPDGSMLASGAYREVKLWRRPRDVRKLSVTSAHRGTVNGLDASPDGATFASAGADGVVRVWGAADGRPVKELAGHGAAVNAVKFSPDGKKLASVSDDRTVRIWAVADGAVFSATPAPAAATAVTWLGAGKKLATAGGDAVVRVWDVPDAPGTVLAGPKELKGHDGPVAALCNAGDTQLLSGGADGTVRRWDVGSGQVVKQVSHGAPVTAVALRPDGKRIASAGGRLIKLWDADGRPVAEMKGDRYANGAAADRGRDLALAASEAVYHKGAAEAAEKRGAEQVDRVKKAAAADSDADKVLAEKQKARADADAKKTQAEAKKKEADAKKVEADVKKADEELKKAADEAKKAADELARAQSAKNAAGDELRLAIKSAQGAADAAADAASAREAAQREQKQVEAELAVLKSAAAAAEKPVRALAFSPDNLVLAAGGEDQAVHTYAAENGAAFETFRGHGGSVNALAFAGAGVVLSGGADGACVGWDPAPQWPPASQLGSAEAGSPFADRVTALDFSADGKLLATGGGVPSREGEVLFWDVATGAMVRKIERLHSDAVLALDLSADGKLIATAAADRFMKVSEVSTGRLVKSFEGHSGHVLGVSFHRNGRTLVTASADNTAKVWDFVGGEQKKTVPGFEKEVTSVRFVGDTDQFVASAGDGKVRLLKPDGGEVRSFAGAVGFVYAAAASRDGSTLVAGAEDGVLRAWNVADGKPFATLPPPDAPSVTSAR
jgi:WD40 repeat protein